MQASLIGFEMVGYNRCDASSSYSSIVLPGHHLRIPAVSSLSLFIP